MGENKKIIVDIDCQQRGITGELSFDGDKYDEMEMMEIAEMTVKVIEAWCKKRDFMMENLSEYRVTIN